MLTKITKYIPLATALLLSTGCATMDPDVKLGSSFWDNKNQTIVVSMAKMPEADHMMLGAQGLLDIAINKENAKTLTTHLKTVKVADYQKVVKDVSDALKAHGFKTRELSEAIDVAALPKRESKEESKGSVVHASQDFTQLKDKIGPHRLLLIAVQSVGTQRTYYGFIPTTPPSAMINVKGEVIDLANNQVLWRQRFNDQAGVTEPWDQPPNYPNVSKAIEKVLLVSRKNLQGAFTTTSAAAQPATSIAAQ